MTYEYQQYLAHYGIKGQKWGVRQYQNEDGSYTQAGAERYWGGGHGRQPGMGQQMPKAAPRVRQQMPAKVRPQRQVQPSVRQQQTPEEAAAARKRRRNRIIAISAGVALTAAAAYVTYKKTGEARDRMKTEMMEGAKKNLEYAQNSGHMKYWDSKDRAEYEGRYMKMMQNTSDRIDRRDVIGQKLGIDLHGGKKGRERVLAERRDQNEFSNWMGDADRRGHLNERIHDARQQLKRTKLEVERARDVRAYRSKVNPSVANNAAALDRMGEKAIKANEDYLNKLLEMRRKGSGK